MKDQSIHSMITRSKKKLIDKQDNKPPDNDDDEIDENGNLKGFIDYDCDEEFDNDMFQK